MTEAQLDRVSAWRKAHRKLLDLPGLTLLELALLLVVERRGVRDVARTVAGGARPDIGWSVRPDGRPDTRRELAALCRLPPGAAGLADLNAAIEGLVELGHLVVADDWSIGMTGWAEQQESPDAHRKREDRERARRAPKALPPGRDPDDGGTPPGQSTECPPQRTEDRGQKTDLNSGDDPRAQAGATPVKNAPPEPRTLGGRIGLTRVQFGLSVAKIAERSGIDAATIRRIEADEALPTRGELEVLARVLGDPDLATVDLPARDEGVVRDVAGQLHDARAALGTDEPRRLVDGGLVREVFAPVELVPTGTTLAEAWAVVIRRAAEQARRNAEDGRPGRDLEFFTLAWLGKPDRWRRFLANSALDQRRQQRAAPARASPRMTGPKNTELPPMVRRDEDDEET